MCVVCLCVSDGHTLNCKARSLYKQFGAVRHSHCKEEKEYYGMNIRLSSHLTLSAPLVNAHSCIFRPEGVNFKVLKNFNFLCLSQCKEHI